MPCYNNQRSCAMKTEPVNISHGMFEQVKIASLAVASVITQPYNSKTYDLSTAFMRGTIYPDLDKPYIGKGGCRKWVLMYADRHF